MPTIKIKSLQIGDETEIRLLIDHPMENGRNRLPESGALAPAHYIEELCIKLNNRTVIKVNMTGSLSKNPYFSFRLKNQISGNKIRVEWRDNRQLGDAAELILP
jgi:sulfur-oxidizing protein SoxZ